MSKCPNCGAPGGGPSGCSSCGLGIDPNVGRHINAGQDQLRAEQERQRRQHPGGPDCFPVGTNILTPLGSVDISTVTIGYVVLSYNFEKQHMEPKRVLKIVPGHLSSNLISMKFSNDETLKCTKNHPFRVDNKWMKAKNLEGQMILLKSANDDKLVKVEHVYAIEDKVEVYNLIVEDNYNFIAEGAVVHSFAYFRSFQVAFYNFIKRVSLNFKKAEISMPSI